MSHVYDIYKPILDSEDPATFIFISAFSALLTSLLDKSWPHLNSLTGDESYQILMRFTINCYQQVAKPFYAEKVEPISLIPKQVGNMYTASLYAAFASLLHNKHNTLAGQRVIMFSYGSGSTAAMFSLKLNEERLQKRYEYTPREFDIFVGLYEARREFGIKNDYWCEMPGSILQPGAYYFRGVVDSEYRRVYGKKTPEIEREIEEIILE
ncbi:hydroxymethylglutaryl-CoA synthase-like [Solanum pennellii]|uniref:Hydroxymethylglutaryl-CoA synthase-like n=1 Tax=Solanum pennellii TaxID=28526 RepID=A0ABM1VHC0_SOLPN|nr:hydroxymethylglutaryl-CoA synthase-like [Solanum pennellii]